MELKWFEGSIWRATIPAAEYLEYKFVFLEGSQVNKWEGGNNRIFNLSEMKSLLEKEKIVDHKISIDSQSEKYVYDHSNSLFIIKCSWKN